MSTLYCRHTDLDMLIQLLPPAELAHMRRVSQLVGTLTTLIYAGGYCPYGAEESICQEFADAAFYHDIGKILVPDYILTKSGCITEQEMSIILKHTMFAKNLFERMAAGLINGVPEELFAAAYASAVYHHERWEGTGYPYGLKKEEIPLIARITSICDAYDAITNTRPYRAKRTHEEACVEIAKNSGAQFDPNLVEIFLNNEQNFYVPQKKFVVL